MPFAISLYRGRPAPPGLALFMTLDDALRGIEGHFRAATSIENDIIAGEIRGLADLVIRVYRPADAGNPVTLVEIWTGPERPASIHAIYRVIEVQQCEPVTD